MRKKFLTKVGILLAVMCIFSSITAVASDDNYYSNPYKSANQSNVCLAAENNTYENYYYYCTGNWDEETWD